MTSFRRSRRLATLAVLLGAAAFACGQNRSAVVVGVNACPAYRLADGSAPRPLRSAESDARGVAAHLIESAGFSPDRVVLLLGRDAACSSVVEALRKKAASLRESDLFFFYFAGHGCQASDEAPFDEPDRLDEALCLYDSTSRGEHLLRDDELGRLLREIQTGQKMVVLDCCHAGSGTKGDDEDLQVRSLPRASQGPIRPRHKELWRELAGSAKGAEGKMTAFFACRPDQQAYERRIPGTSPSRRAGQFTYFWLDGLRNLAADANRDGRVENQELLDYVRRALDRTFNAGRPAPTDRQEPFLESDDPQGSSMASPASNEPARPPSAKPVNQ